MTEDEMIGWHHRLNMSLVRLRELVMYREALHAAVHGIIVRHIWVTEQQQQSHH